MLTEILLHADCDKCAALCCVALAFDKSPLFAIDKPAGTPCQHLIKNGRCGIHADLKAKGFGGCVAYDCLGAGQRVTQGLFDGQSWQDDPTLLDPMMRAFASMRKVQDLLQLLVEAQKLTLPPVKHSEINTSIEILNPPDGWTKASLKAFDASDDAAKVRTLLASLRPFVSRKTP